MAATEVHPGGKSRLAIAGVRKRARLEPPALPREAKAGGLVLPHRYSPASFSTRPIFFLVTKPGPVLMLFAGMTP